MDVGGRVLLRSTEPWTVTVIEWQGKGAKLNQGRRNDMEGDGVAGQRCKMNTRGRNYTEPPVREWLSKCAKKKQDGTT